MPSSAKDVVRRYLDALLAGDLDAMRESFTPDAVWTIHGDLPFAGPWKGRDAIVDDFLVTVGSQLYRPGTTQFEFPTLVGEGDTVALEWRVRATTTHATGYDNRYCGIFVVRDGRIAEVREYLDTAYARAALFPDG